MNRTPLRHARLRCHDHGDQRTLQVAAGVSDGIDDRRRSAACAARYGNAMAVQIRLDHCVIHISDWQRSNPFYRDVMGAELVDRGGGTWAYRFGDAQLNVHGPGVEPHPVALIPVAPGNSDLCFEWLGSIDEAVSHLAKHDVRLEDGPVLRNGAKGQGTSV